MIVYPSNAQPVFFSSATQFHPIGTKGHDYFGREYRYCLVGTGANLVVGNCIQAQAQITQAQDLTPSDGAIGDKIITATAGAAAAVANLYAGGIAVIDVTPGLGFSYPIAGHAAWTSGAVAGGVVLQLQAGWSEQVAITAGASKVSIYPHPYSGVIQSPVTTLTNVIVGVCQFVLVLSQFGWLGVHGHFGTLIQGTPAVSSALSCPASAAGAAAINSGTLPIIGTIMDTGQDGLVQGVLWLL